MSVTPNLLGMILEVFTTGLRKLGSTGKKSFEKYNESFLKKHLAMADNFHLFLFLFE